MRSWTVAALAVAAIVGLGYVHPFGNPRVEPAKGIDTLLQGANIPANTRAVLVEKCADCHSNDPVADLCADCAGILAHRTGYRSGAQGNELVELA